MIIMATNPSRGGIFEGTRSPSPSELPAAVLLQAAAASSSFGNSNSNNNSNNNAVMPNSNKFPCRLHRMLDNAETEHFDHIVSWLKCGKAFAIHDKDQFMRRVIPLYFPRMTSYKSFRRQLSLYGIYQRRIPAIRKSKKKEGSKSSLKHQEGAPTGIYAHPLLIRGDVRSCGLLSRPSTNQKLPPTTSAGDDEGNNDDGMARIPSTTSSTSSSGSMAMDKQGYQVATTPTTSTTSSRINKMFDLKNMKDEESRNSALAFLGAASAPSASSLIGGSAASMMNHHHHHYRPRSISYHGDAAEAVLFSDDSGKRLQGASFTSPSTSAHQGGVVFGREVQRRSLLQEFPHVSSMLFPIADTASSQSAAAPAPTAIPSLSAATASSKQKNIEDSFLLDSPSSRQQQQQQQEGVGAAAAAAASGTTQASSLSSPSRQLEMMTSSSTKPNANDIVDEIIFTFLR